MDRDLIYACIILSKHCEKMSCCDECPLALVCGDVAPCNWNISLANIKEYGEKSQIETDKEKNNEQTE